MLKLLFKPTTIGKLSLSNRVVLTAMHLGMADNDGRITDRLINFYVERAKNLVGMIITGVSFFHLSGRGYLGLQNMIGIHDDESLEGLSKLTQALKAYGTKVAIQLSHPGAHAVSKISGVQATSPSGLPSEITGECTRELALREVEEIIEQFVEAASRARDAGFDAVQILCGKGLVGQFLSPIKNLRRDAFGGNFAGRMKLGIEILKGIKSRLGGDYPVLYRIMLHDFYCGSRTREEAYVFAKALEDLGADALDVTIESHAAVVPRDTMEVPPGGFLYLAHALKSVVNVPVIGNIRINDPLQAEEVLKSGKADLVGIARGFLADPEFLSKSLEGRFDQIRKCIGCCQGCLGMLTQGKPCSCLVNPQVGKEMENRIIPAARRKRVMVVGAGPGGMEAAWILAQRGHETLLFEEKEIVGGQMQIAKIPPGRKDFNLFIEYLSKELARLSVKVELNCKVTAPFILKENPDAVVVATGGTPLMQDISGIRKNHVHTAESILLGQAEIGKHVIIIGGGSVGCETALFIAKKDVLTAEQMQFLAEWEAMDYKSALQGALANRTVTLLEMMGEVGSDIESHTRVFILASLAKYNVKVLTRAKVVEITDNGIYYLHDDKDRYFIPGDTVVLAVGYRSNNKVFEEIRSQMKEVYCVGDCVTPRTAFEAIHEGYEVGLKIGSSDSI